MDERTWALAASVRRFLDEVVSQTHPAKATGPGLRDVVGEHVGEEGLDRPIVQLDVPGHQYVNLDIAVAALVEQDPAARLVGVGGGNRRHHESLGDLLEGGVSWSVPLGPVDRQRLDTGPGVSREVVATGVHLFRYADHPVVLLQRRPQDRYGGECMLEVLAPPYVSEPLLSDVRRLMVERSVFRGQVLSFGLADESYGSSAGGIAFLERPTLAADQVVLPEGTLARIERHIVGPARHRDRLRAAGQHLKRGLLIYGPPGTGKTHTVRYLLGSLPEVTAVLLTGSALRLVGEATELARALQPSVVILEDVDLIAEDRDLYDGPEPLLFTLLNAMDGLDADADVAFLLTTNRADLLEPALAQRPGRVDLAVDVPLPDRVAREALLHLYAGSLPVSPEALAAAAARTEGITASFMKELARRTVLAAAEDDEPITDATLARALDELLDEGQRLTRSLLGSPAGTALELSASEEIDPG